MPRRAISEQVLEPFVRAGYVTYVSFSGRAGAQVAAYGDAVLRAKTRGGVEFLGASEPAWVRFERRRLLFDAQPGGVVLPLRTSGSPSRG